MSQVFRPGYSSSVRSTIRSGIGPSVAVGACGADGRRQSIATPIRLLGCGVPRREGPRSPGGASAAGGNRHPIQVDPGSLVTLADRPGGERGAILLGGALALDRVGQPVVVHVPEGGPPGD